MKNKYTFSYNACFLFSRTLFLAVFFVVSLVSCTKSNAAEGSGSIDPADSGLLANPVSYKYKSNALLEPTADVMQRAHNGDADAMLAVALWLLEKEEYAAAIDWTDKAEQKGNFLAKTLFMLLPALDEQKKANFSYISRNLAPLFPQLEEMARSGNAIAMFQVAIAYENGYVVPRDIHIAYDWYEQAGQSRTFPNGWIQNKVAAWTYKGTGTVADTPRSTIWFVNAAVNGNASAQMFLASMFEDGIGVEKNHPEAFRLYSLVASYGDSKFSARYFAEACYKVGWYYQYGLGVEADSLTAEHWYFLAAAQNYPLAQLALGELALSGVNEEDGAPNYRKAVDLMAAAGEKGLPEAQLFLGKMYSQGLGVGQNSQLAVRWLTKAAAQNNIEAQVLLADHYLNGDGVGVDYKRAFELYSAGAEKMNSRALLGLGLLYIEGRGGVAQNFSRARTCLEGAAAQGEPEAFYYLGTIYERGFGVTKNYETAGANYAKAGPKGWYRLGTMFEQGVGTEVDYKQAFVLYERAANAGFAKAQTSLGLMYSKGLGTNRSLNKAKDWLYKASQNGDKEATRHLQTLPAQ